MSSARVVRPAFPLLVAISRSQLRDVSGSLSIVSNVQAKLASRRRTLRSRQTKLSTS